MQQGVVEVAGELIGPILDMEGPADGDTSSAVGADKLPVDDLSVMDAGASSVGERGESERGRRGKLGRDDELDAAEPGTRAEQTTRMEAGWRLPPLLGHPGFQHASWLDVESNSESNSASQSKSNDFDAGEERGPVAEAKTVNPSLLWVGRELGARRYLVNIYFACSSVSCGGPCDSFLGSRESSGSSANSGNKDDGK